MQNLKYFYTGEIYAYFTGETDGNSRRFHAINGNWRGWISDDLKKLWPGKKSLVSPMAVEVLWMADGPVTDGTHALDYNEAIDVIQDMLDADASAPVGVDPEKVLAELAADADNYYAAIRRGWKAYLVRPQPISALSDYKHILVVARSRGEARITHPEEGVVWYPSLCEWRERMGGDGPSYPRFWPSPSLLEVIRVGPYTGDLPPGTVLAVSCREDQ